jgi:2-keto-4-pentenoate hydratase
MKFPKKTLILITMSKAFEDPRIIRGMQKQFKLRRDRLNAGEKSIGWKVGFGAPAALDRLRLDAPLIGFLTDKTLLPSNTTVSIAGWTKPAMEPEIAVYLGQDLTGASDREKTRAAIASLGPAIELAEVHFPPDDVEAILAGNIYNRHVILGRADSSRAGCVLNGLTGRVSRNGQDISPATDPQALTGDIVDIVNHVADLLSFFGELLCAGDVIITGSIVPPLWIVPDEEIIYRLEPIDVVSIKLQ